MTNEFPQALTIAGSDSGGGAGMQADLKTIQMRHVFATTVVVAVTAQNTLGVQDALALPTEIIDAQFASWLTTSRFGRLKRACWPTYPPFRRSCAT